MPSVTQRSKISGHTFEGLNISVLICNEYKSSPDYAKI